MKFKNLVPFPRLILIILILFGLNACIDPYDASFGQDNRVLVVEGLFTNDLQNPDTIKIQYSYYATESVVKRPIAGIQASIVSSAGQETKLNSVGTIMNPRPSKCFQRPQLTRFMMSLIPKADFQVMAKRN
jgi:hypothetical protein